MSDFKIGCHLSTSKGFLHMAKEIVSLGGNTFQFFTRNPRGGAAKAIDEADVKAYHEYAKEHGIDVILAHAPYTLNPCSADENTRNFAKETLYMKIVVYRSPKALRKILYKLLGMK